MVIVVVNLQINLPQHLVFPRVTPPADPVPIQPPHSPPYLPHHTSITKQTMPPLPSTSSSDDSLFQSHYAHPPSYSSSSSSSSSSSDNENDPEPKEPIPLQHNFFAPPFYNRPPTPLPPSPSLTSLLRPSRPTTPDTSDNELEPVPRASPKVPTYEYYGFVLYLFSSLAFCESEPERDFPFPHATRVLHPFRRTGCGETPSCVNGY